MKMLLQYNRRPFAEALLVILFALLSSLQSDAQEVATQIALGRGDCLDTYLSPEKYTGFEGRFISEVLRSSRKRPVAYMLTHEGRLATTENRAGNANALCGSYDFTYSMMYRLPIRNERLRLFVGGMAHYDVGFAYNMRNSANNPAQGYMSLDLGPHVLLRYMLPLLGKTFVINWEGRMPLVGVMFSPNYGQSYYEMFNQGNYDHNVVFTSIAVPQLRHHISVDVPLSTRCALRVGYLGDYRQAKPNNLRQHQYYNAATIGLVIKKN